MKIDKEVKKFNEENSCKKFINKLIVKPIVYSSIFIILFMFSIIFNKKVINFSKLVTSSNFFSGFLVFIYYFSTIANICILLGIAFYTFKQKSFNNKWYLYSEKIYKKIDVPSFILNCIIILGFISIFIFTPCTVSGDSMKNTYSDNDKLICTPIYINLEADDVVIFNSKNYTHGKEEMYIKRVVAKENDVLYYNKDEEVLYSNNVIISNDLSLEMYKIIYDSLGYDGFAVEFTIPKDKLLVFGDNRLVSYDSRYFGLIDEKDVVGKIIFKLYPFKKTVKDIIE